MASSALDLPQVSSRRNALVLLYSGFLLTGVVNALLGPLLPVLQTRFNATESQLGTLFAAQFAGASLGGLVSQWRTKVSIIGGYGLIAAGLVTLAVSGWAMVPIAVFAFGFGLGAAIPATNMTVAHCERDRRAASLNILNLIWGAGATASAVVVAVLMRWLHFSGMLISISAVATIVCAALLLARIPAIPREKPSAENEGRPAGRLVIYCVALFLYIGVEGCVGGWAGKYAAGMPGGAAYISASLVAFWGALLSGRAVAALVLRYVTDFVLFRISLLTTAVGLAIFWIANSGPLIVVAALVAGLGLAPVFALLLSLMTQFAETESTHIPGWLFSMGSMGGAALPWLFGVTSTYFHQQRVGFLIPSIGTALLILFLVAEEKNRRTEPLARAAVR